MVRLEREEGSPAEGSNGAGSPAADPVPSPAVDLFPAEYPAALDLPPAQSPKSRRPYRWLLIAIGILMAILAVDGAGIAANATLSSLYSPERAVTDYFAAQSRGSVTGMLANATFVQGSDPAFFRDSAVTGMMQLPQNRDVKDVHILSTQSIDYSTKTVSVSMTWAGTSRRQAYTVRRDSSRVHDLIYYSWRVDIPFATIQFALPNQAGPMAVDDVNTASEDPDSVQVIQGYHQVTMSANFAYDTSSRLIDAVDYPGVAAFKSTVGSNATFLASKAVTLAFSSCDPSAYWGCLGHTYSARPGHYWVWDLPGYGSVSGTTYQYALAGDPTAVMELTVTTQAGIVDAIGSCTATLTLDGSRTYKFHGYWTAKLTWSSGTFVANLTDFCFETRDDSGTGTV